MRGTAAPTAATTRAVTTATASAATTVGGGTTQSQQLPFPPQAQAQPQPAPQQQQQAGGGGSWFSGQWGWPFQQQPSQQQPQTPAPGGGVGSYQAGQEWRGPNSPQMQPPGGLILSNHAITPYHNIMPPIPLSLLITTPPGVVGSTGYGMLQNLAPLVPGPAKCCLQSGVKKIIVDVERSGLGNRLWAITSAAMMAIGPNHIQSHLIASFICFLLYPFIYYPIFSSTPNHNSLNTLCFILVLM